MYKIKTILLIISLIIITVAYQRRCFACNEFNSDLITIKNTEDENRQWEKLDGLDVVRIYVSIKYLNDLENNGMTCDVLELYIKDRLKTTGIKIINSNDVPVLLVNITKSYLSGITKAETGEPLQITSVTADLIEPVTLYRTPAKVVNISTWSQSEQSNNKLNQAEIIEVVNLVISKFITDYMKNK